jgi:hypothetical protein
MAGVMPLICPTAKAKYICKEGWTRILKNCPSGKSVGLAAAAAMRLIR